MERHCKIGGEGLSNLDVLNEDMISDLPETLLLHILSLVPTYTAITTSVLSKRWESLWKMLPNLKFDSECKFPEDVCNSLISNTSPVLESLNLAIRHKCDPLEMGLPIAIAFSRKLHKLVLKLDVEDDEVILPGIVFRCNNTLQILKLKGSILVDLTSPVCLNSLRELYIYQVNFKDEESFSNLLCGCPRLQDLVLHLDYFAYTFTIAMPSLQRLTLHIYYYRGSGEGGGYVINAPSLKCLNINLLNSLEFCLIENAPELVEANILEVSNAVNENILESLTSAKRLSLCLSPLKIKYPATKIFYQLLSLELRTNAEEWWNLLTLMLESSPKLQILKLVDDVRYLYYFENSGIAPKWNQPKCVPECLLFHLETFVWTSYPWQRENEKEVATYILKNARHLKKATLSTFKTKKLEKRREMLNHLANEVSSNSCHLVFEFNKY